jgi:hypothetical protein
MASYGHFSPLVVIEPAMKRTNDPNNRLKEQLSREPIFVFAVPEIEVADSLEAITKQIKRKKVNKYKNIVKREGTDHVAKKSIPLLRPAYVSKSDRHYYDNGNSIDNIKGGEQYAPFRRFDEEQSQNKPRYDHRYRHLAKSSHDRSTSYLLNRPKPLPRYSEVEYAQKQSPITNEGRSNKYSSRLSTPSPRNVEETKHSSHLSTPSPRNVEETKKPGNSSDSKGRTDKYSSTLSRHRRSLEVEAEEDYEKRSLSSQAMLLTDGDHQLLSPSNSTQYFSATGNSLESKGNSKQSLSSLASSLDATASPDGIIAFGAVVDHLTKGGSIMNANRVYKKEVLMRDQYRTEDPIEANYNKVELHKGKLPQTFVEQREYRYDHSSKGAPRDESHKGISFDDNDVNEDSDIVDSEDEDESSVSTFEVDRYATTTNDCVCDEDDYPNPVEEENDWCVPGQTTEDEGTSTLVCRSESVSDGFLSDPFASMGTSTMVCRSESVSVGFLSDPSATPFSEGSVDYTDFDTDFRGTTFETSDNDSICSDSFDSESDSEDSSSEGVSHFLPSSSTITTYRSFAERNQPKASENKTKTKKLLNIFQGKKRPKEANVDSQGFLVDRLPDSFEDDNNENINTHNTHKFQEKGNAIAAKQHPRHITKTSMKNSVMLDSYQDVPLKSAGNQTTTNTKNTGHSDNRKSDIRAPKQMDRPAPKLISDPRFASENNDKTKPAGILKQGLFQDIKAAATETKAPNDSALADGLATFDMTEKSTEKSYTQHLSSDLPAVESDGEDETICGGSLSMESIVSIDDLLEGLEIGLENAAQFTTDSFRSARSIFFPHDGSCGVQGMTAADDFEEQLKFIEEPEESYSKLFTPTLHDKPVPVPVSTPSGTANPKEIWVPEYADCDEGLEEREEGFATKNTSQLSPAHEAIATPPPSSKKKRKPLRKRIPFLQLKKAGASESGAAATAAKPDKSTEEESDLLDDDYEVGIIVYNRENTVMDIAGYNNLLNPKPLFDIDEGEALLKMITSCDLTMAAESAAEEPQRMLVDHLLSMGTLCCGGISAGRKMIAIPRNKIGILCSDQLVILQDNTEDPNESKCSYNRKVGNQSKAEGQIMSSSQNVNVDDESNKRGISIGLVKKVKAEGLSSENAIDEDENWSEDIGPFLVDFGAYIGGLVTAKPAPEGSEEEARKATIVGEEPSVEEKKRVPSSSTTAEADVVTTVKGEKDCLQSPIELILDDCNHNQNNNNNNNSLRSRGGQSIFSRKKRSVHSSRISTIGHRDSGHKTNDRVLL